MSNEQEEIKAARISIERKLKEEVNWTVFARACYTCKHFKDDKRRLQTDDVFRICACYREKIFSTSENCSCDKWENRNVPEKKG